MSRQRRTARDLRPKEPKAIIAALGDGDDTQSSLDELVLLLKNVNVPVAARVIQKRRAPDPAARFFLPKAARCSQPLTPSADAPNRHRQVTAAAVEIPVINRPNKALCHPDSKNRRSSMTPIPIPKSMAKR